MNKDNYRDYVADAYRYYALCGMPDAGELRRLRMRFVGEVQGVGFRWTARRLVTTPP